MPATPNVWLNEFVVNTETAGTQDQTQIIQLTNGNTLVAWRSTSTAGAASPAGDDIVGRIFNVLGEPVTGEILLNTSFFLDNENLPSIAALPGGGFMMAYQDVGTATSIRLQEYSATGTNVSANTTVVSDASAAFPNFSAPQLAVSSNTASAVFYESIDSAANRRVVAKTYNPETNTYGTETSIVAFGGQNTLGDVTTLTNGNYAIVTTRNNAGDNEIIVRVLTPTLSSVLGVTAVADTRGNGENDREPSITALTGGGFVVSWTNTDTNDTDLKVQRFSAAGAAVGGIIDVAVGSSTDNKNESKVVALSDGGFLVIWDNDEVGQQSIGFERFSAAGARVGNIVTVSNVGTNAIDDIDAVLLRDGRIAIAWENGSDIRMEIYDPRDNATTTNYGGTSHIIGVIGSETINGTGAAESIVGHLGNDSINGGAGNDTIFGGAGNDTLDGGTGNDTVLGGDGNDVIFRRQNQGEDSIDGGAGNDTVNFDNTTAAVNVDLATQRWKTGAGVPDNFLVSIETVIGALGNDTLIGSAAAERLEGRDGNDSLRGGGGSDTLVGGEGSDLLFGEAGADSLDGGAGDDFVQGGAGSDSMDGGAGFDAVSWQDQATAATLNLVNQALNAGSAAGDLIVDFEVLYLTDQGDTVLNDGTGRYIYGFAGNDTITGGAGADFIEGGLGADSLDGGAGFDYVSYVNAATALTLNLQNPGASTGEAAGDVLANFEAFYLGAGSDTFVGRDGPGIQHIVFALGGNDTLTGGSLSNDWLFGGDGNDRLVGGTLDDLLVGGAGADRFVFLSWVGNGSDSILDFSSAEGDRFELVGAGFGLGAGFSFTAGVNFITGSSPFATTAQGTLLYVDSGAFAGQLYYDPDGTGATGAVFLAQLAGTPALAATDFIVT